MGRLWSSMTPMSSGLTGEIEGPSYVSPKCSCPSQRSQLYHWKEDWIEELTVCARGGGERKERVEGRGSSPWRERWWQGRNVGPLHQRADNVSCMGISLGGLWTVAASEAGTQGDLIWWWMETLVNMLLCKSVLISDLAYVPWASAMPMISNTPCFIEWRSK